MTTVSPFPGCITAADNLTSVGCTRLPRSECLGGRPSSPGRWSRPARRRSPEERQQPGSWFGHSIRNRRATRRRGTADGEPSTERRPATTSLATTSPATSQQCAHHQLKPGRRRRVKFQKLCFCHNNQRATPFTIPCSVVPSVHFMTIHSAVLLPNIIFRARDSSAGVKVTIYPVFCTETPSLGISNMFLVVFIH